MDEKMESEQSYSGESSSTSETSSGSSDGDDDAMEPVRILGQSLELPQELCEDYSVFKEFFSMKTWDSLEDHHREHLKKFLPKFSQNDEEEKQKTLKMLFNHEPFHFISPLTIFYNNLRQGNYRPDIAKMRKFLMKARAKQQRHKIKSYYAKMLPEVLISRERLLAAAKAAPPGFSPHLLPKPSHKNNFRPLYLRARQRYFEELAAVRSEVGGEESDDENYPDGPPEQFVWRRKQGGSAQNSDNNISGTLGGMDPSHPTSLECLKNVLSAHRVRRQYRENHPELNTIGITLDDIKQRVALVNGAKKLMFGGSKTESAIQKQKKGSKKEGGQKQAKSQEGKGSKRGKEELDSSDIKPLLPNIKIKCEQEESDSESSSFVDPISSPKQPKNFFDHVDIKQEVTDVTYPSNVSNINVNDPKLESVIKQEPQDSLIPITNASKMNQPVPIKLEDLDGIDMMNLPVEIADDSGEVIPVDTSTEAMDGNVVDPDESLTETTHANFLSLVRALFPARAAHRASKAQLHARCVAVMRSPIAPLNTWYNLSDDWCAELDSALGFLAGERGPHPDDFVPYLQFMPETQMYQWIGAGRDCDAILGRICERWLRAASPPAPSSEPPPPRYPTSWVVRPPTNSELAEFRAQERKRFSSAAKPFTYVQHGYRSSVGPCARGGAVAGAAAAGTCGALLTLERPRHATFAALLRDAIARLPNGEGTRHDVLTMLKMSQWIGPCSDQTLLCAVSSSLDRLHSAKRDPIVKYDQRTAVWTYLHRHRSEEDWIKTTGGRGRAKAGTYAPKQSPAARVKEPHAPTPSHAMDIDVSSMEKDEIMENLSDSDVDVDDSSSSTASAHLSSAQLLMQATRTHPHTTSQLSKAKGKLVATPIQKAKLTQKAIKAATQPSKQAALMTQSVKQANLMAQSVKQATLMSQAKANLSQLKQTLIAQQAKNLPTPPTKQSLPTPSPKQSLSAPSPKQGLPTPPPKQSLPTFSPKQSMSTPLPKQTLPTPLPKQSLSGPSPKQCLPSPSSKQSLPIPASKQANLIQSVKQTSASTAKQTVLKQSVQPKQVSAGKFAQSSTSITQPTNQNVVTTVKTNVPTLQASAQLSKSMPIVAALPQKSPLIKQRPLQKTEVTQLQGSVLSTVSQQISSTSTVLHTAAVSMQSKVAQVTRSLLIRPSTIQGTVATAASTVTTQVTPTSRRGMVRVLSPATQSSGKSLISPRALLQQNIPTTKKRTVTSTATLTTVAQASACPTTVVSSTPTVVTSSVATRTVQLGGRTVQLAANQTVHLPGGQAVQLTSGHTLQLSSLQLPTHSVRLPSGQTVQLATPQGMQAVRVSTAVKNPSPRTLQSTSTVKNIQTSQPTVQIPVSTVQLAGQTVQIGGQTVQLAGQSVQLTGHTVKLPSGQSVQVASQSVLQPQSVQLPSGQTVQLASGNVQTVQLGGSNVQLSSSGVPSSSGQSVQLGSQMMQLAGQTVQLAGGQTVQLPSGQTLQLSSGQTVQLSSGQTLQLSSGQTVQLANQTPKSISQVVRSQAPGEKSAVGQPIVAKLLTNAQGQMISVEGMMGGARTLQVGGAVGMSAGAGVGVSVGGAGAGGMRAVRVLPPAARLARPLLLASGKPLHNIILQQSDGSAIRVTSSGGATTSQTLVLSNIGGQTTSTTSAPVLKLQQVNPLQQVKLAQGIKIQQGASNATVPTSSGVRSVLMDGQQLKLVGGRHVLARILRPAHPPPQ